MSTPPDPYNTPGDDNRGDLPSFQPGAGADQPVPAAKPEPPSSIINAVRLMYVGAVLSAIGIIFGIAMTDSMRDQLAEDDPSLTGDELDAAVAVGVGVAVVIGLISIGLWIWMAMANKRGLGWARIVATVLGGLNILFTLFSLIQATAGTAIISLITIALAAVIIWLLFRPESSQYYDAVNEYRRQYGR